MILKMKFDNNNELIDFEEQKPKGNHSRFYALLKNMVGATKEDLVFAASEGQTESLSELWEFYPQQYDELLQAMQQAAGGQTMPYTYTKGYRKRNADISFEVRKKRSDLLKACAEWGISDKGNGLFWNEINRFLENPKIAGKPIYQMTDEDELQAVIKRVKTMCCNRDKTSDYSAKMKDKIK